MGAPSRPGVVVENSDSLNVPTSPVNSGRHPNAVPATSPLPGGVNISEIDLSSPLNYGTPSSMGSIRTPRSGIRGTPVRARPDIRTDKRMRQVNIGSDAVSFSRQFYLLTYSKITMKQEHQFLSALRTVRPTAVVLPMVIARHCKEPPNVGAVRIIEDDSV